MFGEYNNISWFPLSSADLFKLPKGFGKIYYNGCQNLKEINLSSFDTTNVTNMTGMFLKCKNLTR